MASSSTALQTYAPEDLPQMAAETQELRKAEKKKRKLAKLKEEYVAKNAPHTAYLKRVLEALLPEVEQREAEENAAYETGDPVRQDQITFAQLMQSNEADRSKFIPYEDICDALAHDNYNTLLGERYDGHEMATRSNMEVATLKQTLKDLDEGKLCGVPFDGGGFRLTPEQRLWIMAHMQAVEVPITVAVKARNDEDSEVQIMRPAGCVSDIFFDNVTTGAGKTAITLIKSLKCCVPDDAWAATQAQWHEVNNRGKSLNGLGLVKKRKCEGRTLARVVVVLVPEPLLEQWREHAEKLLEVFKAISRKSFIIWTGLNVEQRQTTTQDGVAKNMSEAERLCLQQNKALLWILVAEPSATKATTHHDPSIAYVARIYDEVAGTRATEPRSRVARESEVLMTGVVNATVKLLKDATHSQATHPIRRAFGGERLSFSSPEHMAIMRHATAPHWARNLLAYGMRPVMPCGVHITNFRIRTESLAAAMHGISDMQITTVDHLLEHTLSGLGLPPSAKQFTAQIKARAKSILMANGQDANGSIASMLDNAVQDATQKLAALPKPVTATAAVQAFTPQQKQANEELQIKHKCFIGMQRLFKQLHDAVDPNPGEPRCCPITFDDTEPEDVVVMACCVNWMCRRALGAIMSNPNERMRKCPFCNKPIGNHAVDDALVQQLLAPMVNGEAAELMPEPPAEPELVVLPGDDASFFNKLEKLKGASFKAGPLAAIQIVKDAIKWKGGKGLRMLLTFHYDLGTNGGSSLTDKVRELMRAEIPELDSVEAVAENEGGDSSYAVKTYQRDDDKNRILIINTRRGSNSLAGLNLGNTDLVLFDRTSGARSRWGVETLSSSQITQAIARALRPQQPMDNDGTNPYANGATEPPASPHAAKIIIFLDTAAR